jgi:hypothetical protein
MMMTDSQDVQLNGRGGGAETTVEVCMAFPNTHEVYFYYSNMEEKLKTITSLQEYSIMSWLTNITNSNSFIYGTIHNEATQLC